MHIVTGELYASEAKVRKALASEPDSQIIDEDDGFKSIRVGKIVLVFNPYDGEEVTGMEYISEPVAQAAMESSYTRFKEEVAPWEEM